MLDGWWAEAYDGLNGFAIGTGRTHSRMEIHDARDGQDLDTDQRRYLEAMNGRTLRRQRVILYISRTLENVPRTFSTSSAMREYYCTLLDQLQGEYAHAHHLLMEIFAGAGARVLPMNDLDHFRHYKTFLNPSLSERCDFDAADGFVPELSIHENCWHSEGNGQSDFGFFL